MLLASIGDEFIKYINQNISPGIGTGVKNISINGILLRALAFDISHRFLYHEVYSYADNVSTHFWF